MKLKLYSRMVKWAKRLTQISFLVTLPIGSPVPVPDPGFGSCGLLGSLLGFCSPAGAQTATQLILGLIGIALVITGFLTVLFVIIGGFRYITAHGNEEQAEGAKKTLTHALIGLVIVILSFVMVRVIANALIFGRGGV